MKRSIYLELVLAFTIIVFFSISIPFMIFQNSIDTIVKNYLQDQIVTNVKNTINTLEKYNLPPETLAELVDFDHISTDIRKDLSSLSLSSQNKNQLETDHVTLLYNSKQNLVTAVAHYENHYILIQWNTSSLARSLKQLGKISTGCSMLLGILIILIFGRIYTKVIRDLRTATQKVTAGDFTQQLPIRNYSDELVSLINSFNKMTKQLQSVEMLRSGFISDVSHQFKTPLTAIEGFARLLEHTKDDNVRKECADVISCETNRLADRQHFNAKPLKQRCGCFKNGANTNRRANSACIGFKRNQMDRKKSDNECTVKRSHLERKRFITVTNLDEFNG